MTASGMKGLISISTVMRSDRGGNGMNLIQRVLMNSGSGDRKSQHINESENTNHDYGYELYKALEYSIRHKKSDNAEFEKKLYDIFIR